MMLLRSSNNHHGSQLQVGRAAYWLSFRIVTRQSSYAAVDLGVETVVWQNAFQGIWNHLGKIRNKPEASDSGSAPLKAAACCCQLVFQLRPTAVTSLKVYCSAALLLPTRHRDTYKLGTLLISKWHRLDNEVSRLIVVPYTFITHSGAPALTVDTFKLPRIHRKLGERFILHIGPTTRNTLSWKHLKIKKE